MTDIEARILKNQIEIMWTLSYLVSKAAPHLVGKAGELDSIRDDLAKSAKNTQAFVDAQ